MHLYDLLYIRLYMYVIFSNIALYLRTMKISIIKITICYLNWNFIVFYLIVYTSTRDNNKR